MLVWPVAQHFVIFVVIVLWLDQNMNISYVPEQNPVPGLMLIATVWEQIMVMNRDVF